MCLQVVQLNVIMCPKQCWGILHSQKYYFGFWLVVWKLNLESGDIGLTNIVFTWQCIFYLVGDFVSVSEHSAHYCSRSVKSKWVVVFPRNKKVCLRRSLWGSFLNIQMQIEKEGFVTKTGFEFSISLMVGLTGPSMSRDSHLGGALRSC